jgi:superfamily II DNA or RNA helicase
MFQPSPFQEAIFSSWTDRAPRHRHLSVNAVAGSGKSTTLEHAAKKVDEPALFAAFNKHIVEAAAPRFAGTRVKIATGHSIGMQANGPCISGTSRSARATTPGNGGER